MLRRVAIATFALAALLVVACGHQVTPSPSTSDLSGDIVLKFRVNGTLDFNDFTYIIAIDTCGGGTPYPQAYNTTYNSFSYGFFVGASYSVALPELFEYFVNPNSSGQILSQMVPESSSLEQFTPNDNGQGNEFELIFNRSELANPLQQAQPCPNISPVPTTAGGATPTATGTVRTSTATATPTPTATPAPSAGPSFSPAPYPTTAAQQTWYFNFFVFQGTTPLDSLGLGGPTDTQFSGGAVNTSISQDIPIFKAVGGNVPSNPSAQLNGGEIQNYP